MIKEEHLNKSKADRDEIEFEKLYEGYTMDLVITTRANKRTLCWLQFSSFSSGFQAPPQP